MSEARPMPGNCQDRGAAKSASDLDFVAAALDEAMHLEDQSVFYSAFRATRLPFLCGDLRDNPAALFEECFRIIHRLGGISPATALAVENHYYVTSALATFPAEAGSAVHAAQTRIVDAIVSGRLLVANTNSKIHSKAIGAIGTAALRENGGFRLNGTAAYASLSTEADLMVVLTEVEGEGFAFFAIHDLKAQPAVEIGDYLFPNAMIDSDTRKITFKDLWLPPDALVANAHSAFAMHLVPFEMAWHQLLLAALYLGAAARAIEEARQFLRATNGRDGKPLAELDGIVVDMGRLAITYRSAVGFALGCGEALSSVKELPRDADRAARLGELAIAAKYTGTQAAEHIVTAVRRIVGARSFVGGNILERLSAEVLFASLGPEVSAVIERRYGSKVLQRDPFTGVDLPEF